MKYFDVERIVIGGKQYRELVASDGTVLDEMAGYTDDNPIRIVAGFMVIEYGEDGHEGYAECFYPVHTRYDDLGVPTDNDEVEVLDKIRHDFPPSEYQNNDW